MIAKSSVTSILDSIISKIEIEIEEIEIEEQETASLHTNQSELENSVTSNKRSKLSCNSIEDVNCRICYDPNQELPVIYPCKCKV